MLIKITRFDNVTEDSTAQATYLVHADDTYWCDTAEQVMDVIQQVLKVKNSICGNCNCGNCKFYRSSVHSKHLLCMTMPETFGCTMFENKQ